MITLENFSEQNRDRRIGNSLYRICKAESGGKWYIHEEYADETGWSSGDFFYSHDLNYVIDKINSFSRERGVLSHVL